LNREQLHALLTEARKQVRHSEFVIVGSLSILGAIAAPPRTMVTSIDVDTYLKNDPQRTGELVQALGQGSAFEDEFGYYLDPVSPHLPSFPQGWQDRLMLLDFGDVKAYFVDPNDVAVSKYMRGEERDMRWLLAGLRSRLLALDIIERRAASAPALQGELAAARKRMAQHRKRLKPA
jgi:hypothetical protein